MYCGWLSDRDLVCQGVGIEKRRNQIRGRELNSYTISLAFCLVLLVFIRVGVAFIMPIYLAFDQPF